MNVPQINFPGRMLKPYAEPVDERQLVEGQIYFAVQFLGDDLLVPTMETLVYVGPYPESPDDHHLFQDAGSYLVVVRYGTDNAEDAFFYAQEHGQCNHIFCFEQALNVLLRCSLQRASKGII